MEKTDTGAAQTPSLWGLRDSSSSKLWKKKVPRGSRGRKPGRGDDWITAVGLKNERKRKRDEIEHKRLEHEFKDRLELRKLEMNHEEAMMEKKLELAKLTSGVSQK
jgi:hypothetical protein